MQLSEYLKASRGVSGSLAALLDVSGSLVIQWANGKPVAMERCAAIERATRGAVTCEDLRADLVWHREPDQHWPWHPDGRPMIDVARTMQAPQEARDAA